MVAASREPTLSTRLVIPFRSVLASLPPGRHDELLGELSELDLDARLPHGSAMRLLERAVQVTGNELLGLHAVAAADPGCFDVLEYAMRSSATVEQAIETLNRYLRLMHDAVDLRLEVIDDTACWSVSIAAGLEWPRHASEYVVGLLANALYLTTNGQIVPKQVLLRHSAPADSTEHERLLRSSVRFGASSDAILLSAADLDTPMATADAGLYALMNRHAEMLLERLPRSKSVADRVREFVDQHLQSGEASLEGAARYLHTSARTLRRRLEEEGTSFFVLLDEARRRLALEHLGRSDLAIGEIAFLLGFSRTSSFYKAFRRWTGTTPASYREEHTLPPPPLHSTVPPAKGAPGEDEDRPLLRHGS